MSQRQRSKNELIILSNLSSQEGQTGISRGQFIRLILVSPLKMS